ncbi:MAG: pyridoxal 5'-phosphate synthase glutaminase subunit PdxT [Bacteroides sp.]|nr:pyridoxal 5'-phosphate synthase glutaminase subunit PdxT [Bacteroides sp.]MCM1446902.1 pyridoxal 5'-phosphate synthase glutaminase subunit PdxT [Bacteroides sp.]
MKIAVLALQGAFAEHVRMLKTLGIDSFLVRNRDDWDQPKDGLIIPGGESTAITCILRDEDLFLPIREAIMQGLPVFGTCAGLIMLDGEHLDTMDIKVRRNAYGRQLGSFNANGDCHGIGIVPMIFIRAPYIESVGEEVEIISILDGHIVAARQGNQLVTAFHPELSDDTRVHEYFIRMAEVRCS